MLLSERIQEAMNSAKLTPAKLAKKVKVSRTTVSLWLSNDTKSLKAESAFALEAATGYRASWLVKGTGLRKLIDSNAWPFSPGLHSVIFELSSDELCRLESVIRAYLGADED